MRFFIYILNSSFLYGEKIFLNPTSRVMLTHSLSQMCLKAIKLYLKLFSNFTVVTKIDTHIVCMRVCMR